jgi:carboxymethylenebutenolidase
MCFDSQARPPAPPRRDHHATSRRVIITSSDDTRVAATLATTDATVEVGMVVLPDVRGLHHYYELLASEVAATGMHAIAIDPYARSAGSAYREDDFDYAPHRAAATDAGLRTDVQAAIEALREAGATTVYVWGFCFGGRAAFMQASQPNVAGTIGFYGWPTRAEEGGSSPVEEARAGLVRVPVLAIYGGADEKISGEDIEAYDDALRGAGIAHETVVYPGAPHSFFDRRMSENALACEDAWRRVLDFAHGAARMG